MKKMEIKFPMDKPNGTKEKYQDVGQEKVVANGGYVVQFLFHVG
jgi:hypothetical protein